MPRRDFARVVLQLRRGQHVGKEGVHYVRLPELTIEAMKPVSVNVDGEVSDSRRLEYRARPKDLLVHLMHRPGEETTETESKRYKKKGSPRLRAPRAAV
jgi:diacylglycerol kinase family enzyme